MLRAQFAQADHLPFADVLTRERLEAALDEENATWREAIYTPALTLWAKGVTPRRSTTAPATPTITEAHSR